MDYSTGKLAFIGIVAVVLTALGSWLIAWRYRHRDAAVDERAGRSVALRQSGRRAARR